MRKKLLSVLLTLVMLLSLIPAGYAVDIEIVDEPVGADAPGGPLDEIVIDEDDTVGADALGGPPFPLAPFRKRGLSAKLTGGSSCAISSSSP